MSPWKVPNHVLERLHGTGFENLAKLIEPLEHQTTLTAALVKFYDDRKRCFVFNGNNLFFGLEDILKITGLPIDGKAVIGEDGSDESFVEKYLKGSRNKLTIVRGGITLPSIRNAYADFNESSDEYIRAYVLYLIGVAISPTKKLVVPGFFLSFLKDVDSIKYYAWGAAMLAFIHNSLKKAEDGSSADGQSLFLTIFILEHVPRVGTVFHVSDVEYPNTFPLALGWIELLRNWAKNHSSRPTDSTMNDLFSQLTHEEITWFPYDRLSEVFLPAPYSEQVYMGYSLTSIFCMEKRILHDPTLRAGVDHVSDEIYSHHEKLLDLYKVAKDWSRKGRKKNWTDIHRDFLKHWEHRMDYLVKPIYAEPFTRAGVYPTSSSSPSWYSLEDDLGDKEGVDVATTPHVASTFSLENDFTETQSIVSEQELAHRELQNEHAQSDAQKAYDLLLLVVKEKNWKIQDLLERVKALEEVVTAVQMAENLKTLEIKEKNKVIAELEIKLDDRDRQMEGQSKSLFDVREKERQLETMLQASKKELEELQAHFINERIHLEAQIQEVVSQKNELLEENEKLSVYREELLIQMEGLHSRIIQVNCKVRQLEEILENPEEEKRPAT